jgi:ribose transport system ATP-binding protein
VSFTAHEGEILGVSGLVGSGRSTLARTLFGAQPKTSGAIEIAGKPVELGSPIEAIASGVALVTEDRKADGLVLTLGVRQNITLARLGGVSWGGQLNIGRERQIASRYIDMLRISTPHADQKTINLSGGNQQKVVLAKWLYTEAKILIIDEPTRGIDVGAKAEIYALLQELVKAGKTIIMISSELPELVGMSDRILVMHEGRISGELDRDSFSEEKIMTFAAGMTH